MSTILKTSEYKLTKWKKRFGAVVEKGTAILKHTIHKEASGKINVQHMTEEKLEYKPFALFILEQLEATLLQKPNSLLFTLMMDTLRLLNSRDQNEVACSTKVQFSYFSATNSQHLMLNSDSLKVLFLPKLILPTKVNKIFCFSPLMVWTILGLFICWVFCIYH